MAGAGYKLFSTGDVLSASDVNTYLQQQTVMVFASAAARTTALASVLAEGMVSYLKDTDVVEIYTGASWVSLDDPNAIQNSIVDAKGDIITATADNTPARLAVGANNTVLTADSSTATGLKWATAASGGTTVKVVSGTTSTNYTNSTTTYANTFTLSITPTATTSKIAVFAFLTTSVITSSSAFGIVRAFNTTTSTAGQANESSQGTTSGNWEFPRPVMWLDSPASTSSQTYTIQIAKGSSGSGDISTSGNPIFIMLMEIGA